MRYGRSRVVVLVCWLGACGGKSVSREGGGGTTGQNDQTTTHSCVSLCEQAKQCPDVATTMLDCNAFCTEYENIARKGGCASTLDALFACYTPANVCGGASECDADSEIVSQCLSTFCTAHATDADCKALLSSVGA